MDSCEDATRDNQSWTLTRDSDELALALALGLILLAITLAVNFLVQWLKASARRRAYV